MIDFGTEQSDFSPFTSLCEALMFMAVHSPRPFVSFECILLANVSEINIHVCQGESNLKFIVFMLKKLGHPIQSVDSIKRIQLPGFTQPKRVRCSLSYKCTLSAVKNTLLLII